MSTFLPRIVAPGWAGVFALLLAGATSQAAETRLGVNQPAPSLDSARWLHGAPLKQFATGQVYVVEFRSATNSDARGLTPASAALAQKHAGQARFISVTLAVPGADTAAKAASTAAFVKNQGPRLAYDLVSDAEDGRLARTWLAAAGQTNLPVAFVIGKDTAIHWLGDPAKGLAESLVSVLGVLRPDQPVAAPSPELALRRRVSELRRAGKPKEALAALNEATEGDPILARSAVSLRMSLLLQLDPAAASQEARKMADGLYRNDSPVLASLAGILMTARASADKAFALTLAERACEQTGYAEGSMISTLARAQAGNGEPGKAVESLETFAKKLETSGGANSRQLRSVQAEILRYRKAAGLPVPPSVPPGDPAEKKLGAPQ